MSYDSDLYRRQFSGANSLAKAREFTVASMGMPGKSFIDYCKNDFKAAIKTQFKNVIKTDETLEAIAEEMTHFIKARFLGYVKAKNRTEFGAWVVVNEKEEPIISSRKTMKDFVLYALAESFKTLAPQDNTLEETAKKQIVDESNFDKFLKDFFMVRTVAEIPFGFDPSGIEERSLVTFGSTIPGIGFYHQAEFVHERLFPNGTDSLDRILKYVRHVSQKVRDEAKKNPGFLTIIHTPSHVMNLKIGELLQGNLEDRVKVFRDRCETLMSVKLNNDIIKSLKENLFREFPKFKIALEEALANPLTNLRSLCTLVIKTIAIHTPDLIVLNRVKAGLWSVIRSTVLLKEKIPARLSIGDTNWIDYAAIDCGPDMEMEGITLYYTKSDGKPSYKGVRDVSEWSIYDYVSRINNPYEHVYVI